MENATETVKKLDSLLKQSSNILIVCHTGADPDALSSLVAAKTILVEQYGKSNTLAVGERIPASLAFIPNSKSVTNGSIMDVLIKNPIDLVVCLDFSQWHLISKFDEEKIHEYLNKAGIPIAIVDHHPENHKNIESDVYVNLDPTSTAMNLYLIFHQHLQYQLLPKVTDCLLYGIVADTNRFKYGYGDSSTTKVLRAAADIIDNSELTIEQVANSMERFDNKTLHVIATFMKNIKLHTSDFAYTTLSEEDIAADNLDSTKLGDAALYVSNTIISMVDTAQRGVVIYPHLLEENTYTARFRSSSPDFPIDKFAKELGGGGHPQSGAARIKAQNIQEAAEKVLHTITALS